MEWKKGEWTKLGPNVWEYGNPDDQNYVMKVTEDKVYKCYVRAFCIGREKTLAAAKKAVLDKLAEKNTKDKEVQEANRKLNILANDLMRKLGA